MSIYPAVWCALHGNDRKAEQLATARKRAEDVKGGCGAAMGAGIACSIITGATPLARDEWRLSNLMTAALIVLACCAIIAPPAYVGYQDTFEPHETGEKDE